MLVNHAWACDGKLLRLSSIQDPGLDDGEDTPIIPIIALSLSFTTALFCISTSSQSLLASLTSKKLQ